MKPFKKDKKYNYFVRDFNGIEITLRANHAGTKVEFLVNDNFARANGYKDVQSFPSAMKEQLKSCFGDREAWLEYDEALRDFVAYPLSMKN